MKFNNDEKNFLLIHRFVKYSTEDIRDDIAYSFNGEGYAVRNKVSSGPYNKYTFGVSISFRTYDENALIFLAINEDNVRIF